MKFAVSLAMAVLLLGMPLACVVASCQIAPPAHPCCPRTGANLKCPYDALDSAKVATLVASMPAAERMEIAPQISSVLLDSESVAADRSNTYILNRILRI
jgi:hypothetical protein